MALTSKQLIVLDFIKKFIAENGYSPTIREIMNGLALKSPSTVHEHLHHLVLEGLITIDKNKSRTIELLVENEYLLEDDEIVKIPLLNTLKEEVPTEFMKIPKFMLQECDVKELYAFKYGNSVYIVNINKRAPDKLSLTVMDDEFFIEEQPLHKVFGNIISEFRQY